MVVVVDNVLDRGVYFGLNLKRVLFWIRWVFWKGFRSLCIGLLLGNCEFLFCGDYRIYLKI